MFASRRWCSIAAVVLAWLGTAAADVVNVMPAGCTRRQALDAGEYRRLWRFLELGGGYRQWAEKDCYPSRLDEGGLEKSARPIGYVATIAGRDLYVVEIDPAWYGHCKKTASPIMGDVPVDGAKVSALAEHVASLPSLKSLDVREIGFAEAMMRDQRLVFALYLGTADRSAYVECFENLDTALDQAAQKLAPH